MGKIMNDGTILSEMGEYCIETFSGKYFTIRDPQPEMIVLEDIAHGLSQLCRFVGQCEKLYSVAEHSVHVVQDLRNRGLPVHVQRAGILHDAAEAYLGDVSRPLKKSLISYSQYEKKAMRAIHEKFKVIISPPEEREVIQSDIAVLRTEAATIMRSRGRTWPFGSTPAADVNIQCWGPEQAKAEFLEECENVGIL